MKTLFDKIIITSYDAREVSALVNLYGMIRFDDEGFADFPLETYVHIGVGIKVYLIHVTRACSDVVAMLGMWEIIKTLHPQVWMVLGDFLQQYPEQMKEIIMSESTDRELIQHSRRLMDIHDVGHVARVTTIAIHQHQALESSVAYIQHFVDQYIKTVIHNLPRKTYKLFNRVR